MSNNKGKNNPNYRHGKYCKTTHYYCCRCNKEIDKMGRSKMCPKCRQTVDNSFKGRKHSEKAKKRIGLKSKAKFTKEYIEKNYRSKFQGRKKRAVNGYILIKDYNHPNRNNANDIMEHRLIIEKSLGRYLTKEEKVHHINFVRDYNKLINLYLCKNISEHGKVSKSLFKLVEELMNYNIIKFDRKKGIYKTNRSLIRQLGVNNE